MTPRHIGIVACSAEGAALCYRTICVEGAAILTVLTEEVAAVE
jgi:aspartate racemase